MFIRTAKSYGHPSLQVKYENSVNLTSRAQFQDAKKYLVPKNLLSARVCHPYAGAMLIFSVLFQFFLCRPEGGNSIPCWCMCNFHFGG